MLVFAGAGIVILALALALVPGSGIAGTRSRRARPAADVMEPGSPSRGVTAAGIINDRAADTAAQDGGTIPDDLGRPFPLPAETPARIVSMAPNITEILFALGLGGRVVGVTRYCDYPAGAAAVPKVGGLIDPNVEVILSLHPDLVLAFRGNPLRVIDRLGELRVPVFVLDMGGGLNEMCGLVSRVGRVTRREKEAAVLVARLEARLAAVGEALAGAAGRPRVFVILHSQGLWTSGGEGYLSDLVARAGAVNIAAAVPRKWVLYSRERIIRDDPDAVFVLARSRPEFVASRAWLEGEARLGGVKAVRAGRVFLLDQDSASRFGPRLVDVLETMARDLHPGRFGQAGGRAPGTRSLPRGGGR